MTVFGLSPYPPNGRDRVGVANAGTATGGGDFGGAERDRTADLHVANVALSQLSYGPKTMRNLIDLL